MTAPKDTAASGTDPALERLLVFLRDHRGFDSTGYKRASLGRRITRRMQALDLDSFEAYQDRLEANPDEFSPLFNHILANVTGFFRDPKAWAVLEQQVLPRLLEEKAASDPVRVWSAGCSSGEEPYTLAMLLSRVLGTEAFRERVKIYATDVDKAALEQARHARYAETALESVPEELRAAYFTPVGNDQYELRSELRRQVIFGRHDLNVDAPLSNLDLLVCRNVLMYFDADAQSRIRARFQYALRDSGHLFAGRAETLMGCSNRFLPVNGEACIFTKRFPGRSARGTVAVAGEPAEASGEPPAGVRLSDLALELSPIPQLVLDSQRRLVLANQQARILFGVIPGDLGQPFQDLEISYRLADLCSLLDSVHSGRRVGKLEEMEWRSDGRVRHFNVVVTRLGTPGGDEGVSIVFAEATRARERPEALERANDALAASRLQLQTAKHEKKTTNEELQRCADELSRANLTRDTARDAALTKSRFLASMSHEIRTPLSGVLGMTEVLLGTGLSPEQTDCVDAIALSGKLLLGIVNDILDLSRIEAGQLTLERVGFRLRDAIDDTLHLLAEPAQRKGLELCGLVEAEVPVKVLGDPGRFRQLLVNLVGNATKFTDRGEVAVRVGASCEEGEPVWVGVEVADTGPGVHEDLREEIFEPFSQADSSSRRRHGGTGLGLSVCKRLVKAMDGEIGFDSEPGKGSRFWFTLPFSLSEDRGAPQPGFDGQRVLLVMGNATARQFAEDRLQQLGLATVAIDQGLCAVKEARSAYTGGQGFDVVLVDRTLPDMDGLELVTRFLAEPGLHTLPLVVLTPLHRRHETLEAVAGRCRCVVKPLREEELRKCLRTIFGGRSTVGPSPGDRTPPAPPKALAAPGRVLLAEDNEVNRRVAVALLRRCGCAVDTAHDGEEAVQLAALTRYDLILMDWRMPEVDGLEATRQIRAGTGASRHSPIVAVTANALPEHREECLAAGMSDYVTKPLTGKALEGVLGRWIGAAVEPDTQGPDRLPDNLEELRRLLGHQEFASLIRLALETFPLDIERMDRPIGERDAAALGRIAHGLKGKCAQFGTARLIELCAGLEKAGESGAWGAAAEIVSEFRTEYGKYQVLLQSLANLEWKDATPAPDEHPHVLE